MRTCLVFFLTLVFLSVSSFWLVPKVRFGMPVYSSLYSCDNYFSALSGTPSLNVSAKFLASLEASSPVLLVVKEQNSSTSFISYLLQYLLWPRHLRTHLLSRGPIPSGYEFIVFYDVPVGHSFRGALFGRTVVLSQPKN